MEEVGLTTRLTGVSFGIAWVLPPPAHGTNRLHGRGVYSAKELRLVVRQQVHRMQSDVEAIASGVNDVDVYGIIPVR